MPTRTKGKDMLIVDEKTGELRPMTGREIGDYNSRSIRQIQNNIPSNILIKLGTDFGSEAAKGTALYRDERGIL